MLEVCKDVQVLACGDGVMSEERVGRAEVSRADPAAEFLQSTFRTAGAGQDLVSILAHETPRRPAVHNLEVSRVCARLKNCGDQRIVHVEDPLEELIWQSVQAGETFGSIESFEL